MSSAPKTWYAALRKSGELKSERKSKNLACSESYRDFEVSPQKKNTQYTVVFCVLIFYYFSRFKVDSCVYTNDLHKTLQSRGISDLYVLSGVNSDSGKELFHANRFLVSLRVF